MIELDYVAANTYQHNFSDLFDVYDAVAILGKWTIAVVILLVPAVDST